MWNNCRATSFRLNPMIKIIEHSVSGAICTFWSCILTAIARPQAPLSHPARARGRVFTAGLIPITLYRFVFADFLLLSKSCHHVSAPSLHSVLKGQSHCWALNWARKTATNGSANICHGLEAPATKPQQKSHVPMERSKPEFKQAK
jgi:hypothetical protein